jgi:hypothetical protein
VQQGQQLPLQAEREVFDAVIAVADIPATADGALLAENGPAGPFSRLLATGGPPGPAAAGLADGTLLRGPAAGPALRPTGTRGPRQELGYRVPDQYDLAVSAISALDASGSRAVSVSVRKAIRCR